MEVLKKVYKFFNSGFGGVVAEGTWVEINLGTKGALLPGSRGGEGAGEGEGEGVSERGGEGANIWEELGLGDLAVVGGASVWSPYTHSQII